jgi:alanine-glyoxylate transaminase/serine-glyoxylate transaminase/serine-pyruvate transaminase
MKDRKLLMIPGPVEFDQAVISAIGEPTDSHVSKEFIESFGNSLEMLKKIFYSPNGYPFIIAGSGTLAMEMAVVNLLEPGDRVIVISTGYFGIRFKDLLARFGIEVELLSASIGEAPSLDRMEDVMRSGNFKLITATHVDTSTAVRLDVKTIARLGRQYGILTVVDGVAAAGGERLLQDEWGVDVYFTASQKAIGVPPGLALLVVSPWALEAFQKRRNPINNYYTDFNNWLPVMQAYINRQAAYFGTPAVNLIKALEVSLHQILDEGMDTRFARHARLSKAFRAAIKAIGLKMVPKSEEVAANTLSAIYYPPGVDVSLLAEVNSKGVILAGGILPEIKGSYFRVGHMGVVNHNDILATIGAIEAGLQVMGYGLRPGDGLIAAQQVLLEKIY